MNYTIRSFVWSKEQYTLREVLENFKSNLPFLVVVAQGYLGRDEQLHTISADEIYWLHRVESQTRMVVRTNGRYVSIPKDLTAKVHGYTSRGTEKRNISIDKMIASSCSAFRFVNEEHLELFDGAGDGSETKLGKMTVEDIYEEPYIVAHSLIEGTLWEGEVTIPSYMHITLSLADGLVGGKSSDLAKTVFDFTKLANSFKRERAITCKEILLFEGKPKEGDYAFLPPKMFISQIQKASRRYEQDAPFVTENEARGQQRDKKKEVAADNALPLPPRAVRHESDARRPQPTSSHRRSVTSGADKASKSIPVPAQHEYCPLTLTPETLDKEYETIGEVLRPSLQSQSSTKVRFASDFVRDLKKSLKKVTDHKGNSGQHAGDSTTPDENWRTPGQLTVKEQQQQLEESTLASAGDPSKSGPYGWIHQEKPKGPSSQTPAVSSNPVQVSTTAMPALQRLGTLEQVPADLTSLTVDDVCQCLEMLNMKESIESFRKEMVDGELLASMDEQLFQEGFNLTPLHARKLMKFVKGWRPKT